jgi:hypothetical protein
MTPAELSMAYASRDLVTITMTAISAVAVMAHFILKGSPLPFIRDHREIWVRSYDTILFIGWLATFSLISIAKI